MILDTITKHGTQQDLEGHMNQDRGNGQVTAPTLRSGLSKSSNRVNPGGGQVDAGTSDSPAKISA
jgi:hypothetical protein